MNAVVVVFYLDAALSLGQLEQSGTSMTQKRVFTWTSQFQVSIRIKGEPSLACLVGH